MENTKLENPAPGTRAVIIVLTRGSAEYAGYVSMENLAAFSMHKEDVLAMTKVRRLVTARGLGPTGQMMSMVSFDPIMQVDPSSDSLFISKNDIFKVLSAPDAFQKQYESIVSTIAVATPEQTSAIVKP